MDTIQILTVFRCDIIYGGFIGNKIFINVSEIFIRIIYELLIAMIFHKHTNLFIKTRIMMMFALLAKLLKCTNTKAVMISNRTYVIVELLSIKYFNSAKFSGWCK